MPTKPAPSDLPTQAFPSSAEFESFLEREHATAPGVYVKLAKKSSKIPSITSAEAVEVALCYGWIDGRANALDDNYWTVRYTPRRAKSLWSQKNVGTIARLIEEGRMRPAGLAVVEAAKEDGRWDRAYAGPATMTEDKEFKAALAAEPAAEAFWKSLNESDKNSALWKIQTVSEKARAGRIEAVVQMLAAGQQPGASPAPAKANAKAKAKATTKAKAKTTAKVESKPQPGRSDSVQKKYNTRARRGTPPIPHNETRGFLKKVAPS